MGATAAAGSSGAGTVPVLPSWLWAGFLLATLISAPAVIAPAGVGRLLQPLTVFHPEWVGDRITRVTDALARFRERPLSLANAFAGAVPVRDRGGEQFEQVRSLFGLVWGSGARA